MGAGEPEAYFLFWRPLFRMNKFYYTYKGHDIFFLQKKLAALELYARELDGVVGPELLYAVVQFQKQMDLQLTGYPDPTTLFLICQLAGQSENGLTDEPL
jgi:peptidoglycan hydrolase-like protein with peptidoglycan-binding domain